MGSAGGSGGASLLGGALTLAGANAEAEAIRHQAAFEQQQLAFNKKIAEINAKDAIDRGDQNIKDFKKQASKVQGSQQAALAAQGIDVDSGTAAGVKYETEKQIETDVARIKNNAWREAWGYKIEATNLQTQSAITGLSAKNRANNTILAGGIQATGQFLSAAQSFSKG